MRQFGSGFKNTLQQIEGPYGDESSGFGSAFAGGQGLHLSDLMGPTENGFGQMPELTQMEGPFEFGRRKRRSGRKASKKSRKGSRKGRKSRGRKSRGRKSVRKMSKRLLRKIRSDLKMFKKGMCRKMSGGFRKCTKSQRKRVSKLKRMF